MTIVILRRRPDIQFGHFERANASSTVIDAPYTWWRETARQVWTVSVLQSRSCGGIFIGPVCVSSVEFEEADEDTQNGEGERNPTEMMAVS